MARAERVALSAGLDAKRFPLLRNLKWAGCAFSVPWLLLNEEYAQKNHGQSLARLAERGGLDPVELVANIRHMDQYDLDGKITLQEAVAIVNELASNAN